MKTYIAAAILFQQIYANKLDQNEAGSQALDAYEVGKWSSI